MIKLSISNIAWDISVEEEAYLLISNLGVSGVEIAPTKLSPWEGLSKDKLKNAKSLIESFGLKVSSLQAILYGKPEFQLLGDKSNFQLFKEHIWKVSEIAVTLGADVAVFGAPLNRIKGEMSYDDAFQLSVDRLSIIGETINESMILGIEPVPAIYNSDFLQSADEVRNLVKSINHPSIRLHLDTACVKLQNDDIGEEIKKGRDVLCHFHISEPNLSDFSSPVADHETAAKYLNELTYQGWVCIEMNQSNNWITSVQQAIDFAKSIYLSTHSSLVS